MNAPVSHPPAFGPEPLRSPVFRMLWLAWLAANITMWMNDVAAAWLMTSLTDSAVMVALVQAASTLPVFLLGLPSGALADIVDRRRYFAVTQLWVACVAVVLAPARRRQPAHRAAAAAAHLRQRHRHGDALAGVRRHRARGRAARTSCRPALALNGMSMNMSRVIGPVVAGALLAGAGSAVRVPAQRGAVDRGLPADPALAVAAPGQRACPASASSAPCAWACST